MHVCHCLQPTGKHSIAIVALHEKSADNRGKQAVPATGKLSALASARLDPVRSGFLLNAPGKPNSGHFPLVCGNSSPSLFRTSSCIFARTTTRLNCARIARLAWAALLAFCDRRLPKQRGPRPHCSRPPHAGRPDVGDAGLHPAVSAASLPVPLGERFAAAAIERRSQRRRGRAASRSQCRRCRAVRQRRIALLICQTHGRPASRRSKLRRPISRCPMFLRSSRELRSIHADRHQSFAEHDDRARPSPIATRNSPLTKHQSIARLRRQPTESAALDTIDNGSLSRYSPFRRSRCQRHRRRSATHDRY